MTELPYQIWPSIADHAESLKTQHLAELFNADPDRATRYFLTCAGISLDYSKNFFTAQTQQLMVELLAQSGTVERVGAMFEGARLNSTEDRAALHTLLRAEQPASEKLQPEFQQVQDTLDRLEQISGRIRNGDWLGSTGEAITDIVHIGIGGSYLGPKMVDEALAASRGVETDISCHYIANVDAHHLTSVLQQLDPAKTLVIIVSKTFTTLETMANANTAKHWLGESLSDLTPHLIAVSANVTAAANFGIKAESVLPMWDWVGGRYSVWSAVGIPIAIRYGFSEFKALLEGAAEMDQHFLNTPVADNIPMVLGFLGVLYQHCFAAGSHAVLTYDHRLRLLPDHLQQVDMESNGKSVNLAGDSIHYDTGAIIWGGEGTNGQHAFHQLLHQGTRFTSIDFIMTLTPSHTLTHHHDKLISSCLSQSQALMIGRSYDEMAGEESELKRLHKVMPGNRPSNTIMLDQVDAKTVGALIAMYEHKVFVQASLWKNNPFDQWGVELGKELGDKILGALSGSETMLDPSTQNLLSKYLALRN